MLSVWVFHKLKSCGLPIVCIDARHAKAALSLQINKNRRERRARHLPNRTRRLVSTSAGKEYGDARRPRHDYPRAQLVNTALKVKNTVRGLLKTFRAVLKIGGQRRTFNWPGRLFRIIQFCLQSLSRC
jgi:transposase